MLSALNAANVEYLVVGAYAMAAHGCPRATGDIDFWVRPTKANAIRVWTALQFFGASTSQISVDDFATLDVVYQIGLAPQRIDILTSISGVEFDDAWKNHVTADLDGIIAFVISRNDLRRNKISSARPKDILDVHVLDSHDG